MSAPEAMTALWKSLALCLFVTACGGDVSSDARDVDAGAEAGVPDAEPEAAQPVDPCADVPCGGPCATCSARECFKGLCNEQGECLPGIPILQCPECDTDADCPQPPPTCFTCPDGVKTWCPQQVCDSNQCVEVVPDCGPSPGYQPCKDVCPVCSLCDPADPDCVEPPGTRHCQTDGTCTPGYVPCPF